MKKRSLILAILLIMAVTIVGCSSKTSSSEKNSASSKVKKIVVGTTGNSPEISFMDKNGKLTGYDVEVLKEVDKRIPDYEFEFSTMAFSSLFTALDTKKVDLIDGCLRRSEEREKKYIFDKESYNYYPYRIIVPQSNTDINSIADLKGKKVGVGAASLQAQLLEEYNKAHGGKINIVYITEDAVNLLKTKRIDATVLGDFFVNVLNKTVNAQVKAVGEVVAAPSGMGADSNAYFLYRKDEVDLRDKVDKALKSMKADGTLSKLSLQWFGVDYVKSMK